MPNAVRRSSLRSKLKIELAAHCSVRIEFGIEFYLPNYAQLKELGTVAFVQSNRLLK